jgi:hypothetical protein
MGSHYHRIVVGLALLLAATELAAKPKKVPPPPPPPPPAPLVVYIPPRPTPPLGASPLFKVPAVTPTGLHQSINTGIGPLQTVWNFRSAYNVAALDCQSAEHGEVLTGYKHFLKVHKVALLKANRGVDADFRKRHGAAYIRPREAYMTQVYNYYAFPPTLHNFCDAALLMARESMALKPAELNAFAGRYLPQFDMIFENFYRSYDQYRADAAAWDARYAPVTVQVAPPAIVPVAGVIPSPVTTTTTTAAPGR